MRFAGCAAFLLGAGLAGPLSPGTERLLTAVALAAVTAWAWPSVRASPGRWRLLALGAPALPLLAGASSERSLALLGVLGALTLLAAAGGGDRGAELARLVRAVAAVTLVLVAARHLAPAWWILDRAAAGVSWLASRLSGEPLDLGPTYAGLWPALLALALTASGARPPARRLRTALLFVPACIALVVAFVALLPAAERLAEAALASLLAVPEPHRPFAVPPAALSSAAAPVLLALLLFAARLLDTAEPPLEPGPDRLHRGRWVAGGLAVATAAALLHGPGLPGPAGGARIAVLDHERLDWSEPVRGRYGLTQMGMFGMLVRYLSASGYAVERIERATAESLTGLSALVIINPTEEPSREELAEIWRFVRRGGGLLVLGDHTDLAGMQEPLNRILEPVGVRYEFDSAFPVRRHWRFSQELRPHPVTRGAEDAEDLQIGTGASLTLHGGRMRPLVVGRYGFGDFGNRANDGRGALLGDYRYQRGERLGDVVLVAGGGAGQGRVLVFGDTSSFQTLALPYAFGFIERTARYLTRGGAWPPALRWLLIALLLGGLGALLLSGAGWRLLPTIALLLLAAEAGRALGGSPGPPPLDGGRLAVVDTTHVERFATEYWREGSVGGLFAALFRAGYVVLDSGEAGPDALERAALVAYVAPTRRLAERELKGLRALLDRGGTLLVAAGGRDREAAGEILALCGGRLTRRPLGAAVVPWGDRTVEFVDAWALELAAGSPLTVRAALDDQVVVAESRPGAGRCLAFGDGRFFEDGNLEGEFRFRANNALFLERLLAAEGGP